MMKKYIAHIIEADNLNDVIAEVEGYAPTPQEFHKRVILNEINWPKEEVLLVYNEEGKRVFHIKKGFSGS